MKKQYHKQCLFVCCKSKTNKQRYWYSCIINICHGTETQIPTSCYSFVSFPTSRFHYGDAHKNKNSGWELKLLAGTPLLGVQCYFETRYYLFQFPQTLLVFTQVKEKLEAYLKFVQESKKISFKT